MELVYTPKAAIVCSICLEVPTNPVECIGCCQIYCKECIYEWFKRSENYICPLRCEFGSVRPVQGALKRFLACTVDPTVSIDYSIDDNEGSHMEIVKEKDIDWKNLTEREDFWVAVAKNWFRTAYKY